MVRAIIAAFTSALAVKLRGTTCNQCATCHLPVLPESGSQLSATVVSCSPGDLRPSNATAACYNNCELLSCITTCFYDAQSQHGMYMTTCKVPQHAAHSHHSCVSTTIAPRHAQTVHAPIGDSNRTCHRIFYTTTKPDKMHYTGSKLWLAQCCASYQLAIPSTPST
jgi:hypothetical protein